MNAQEKELLTQAELASLLGVKPLAIRDWQRKKGLPSIRISAKTIRFKRSAIDKWLEKFSVTEKEKP